MISEPRQIADKLKKIAEEINDALNTAQSGWKGEAAEAFLRKCRQFQTRLETEIKNLYAEADK